MFFFFFRKNVLILSILKKIYLHLVNQFNKIK